MNGRQSVTILAVILCPSALIQSCKEPTSFQTSSASLKNTDVFQYALASGDEEAARILSQAEHYAVSEIRRSAQTNWVATYVYQPPAGFVGSDYVEMEVLTGSDGASLSTHARRIAFRFDIHS